LTDEQPESRAVNRASRKVWDRTCSVEELATFSGPLPPPSNKKSTATSAVHRSGILTPDASEFVGRIRSEFADRAVMQ
jgi:hypothetical protein